MTQLSNCTQSPKVFDSDSSSQDSEYTGLWLMSDGQFGGMLTNIRKFKASR